MVDLSGCGLHRHRGHVLQRHLSAAGRVEEQVPDIRQVLAHGRLAPHGDVEDLLLMVVAADRDAGDQDGRLPPDVAGLEAEARRRCHVGLDLYRRPFDLARDLRIDDAVQVREPLPDLLRLQVEGLLVRAVEAHGDRLPGVRPRRLERGRGVGLERVAQTHKAVESVPYGRYGRAVVGLGVEADPGLGRVDIDHLVAHEGLSQFGVDVAHPAEGAQGAARPARDALHLWQRRAGLRLPLDQEVAVLEGRDHGTSAKLREHRGADYDEETHGAVDPGRPTHEAPQGEPEASLDPPGEPACALLRRVRCS